jgi:EAL domain-containing protein (putative c-di-GMP-specific phosphodiesterase class I)
LDDFGTGYSSLFNLRNFNIDCIKIDRSFVAALGKEKNSTAIVTSITQLGRSLGLNVVAEGVEDRFQHQALRMAGCSHMQGFLFGRPMVGAEADRLAHQPAREASTPDLESNFA